MGSMLFAYLFRTSQVFSLIVLLVFCQQTTAQVPPNGWRLADSAELRDDARKASSTRFTRSDGDFNGDGVKDSAFVLKSTRVKGEALWVWLSKPEGAHRWIQLNKREFGKDNFFVGLIMAVETKKPGVVSYTCFYVAKECDFQSDTTSPKLKLRDDSIIYFKPESTASLYFWSRKHTRFLQVQLSE